MTILVSDDTGNRYVFRNAPKEWMFFEDGVLYTQEGRVVGKPVLEILAKEEVD